MKKDKSENTQVKVKKQYNVVKRMILYNIILIVAVIFLGSLIVFGVKYDSLKTRNRENLLTASKKTAENTDTILTLLDRISSTLFLGQEFQNAAEEYQQKHSDESYAKNFLRVFRIFVSDFHYQRGGSIFLQTEKITTIRTLCASESAQFVTTRTGRETTICLFWTLICGIFQMRSLS